MKRALIPIVAVLLVAGSGYCGTILVPEDYATIQAGLNVAAEGDEVLVNDGTYVENVIWPQTNNVTLNSVNGFGATIVDGSGDTESCIYVGNGQTGVLIDGFTMKNGYGSLATFHGSIPFGGGVQFDEDVTAVMRNCCLTQNGNASVTYGGGVFISIDSNVTIEDCEFAENQASEVGAVYYRNFTADGLMANCVIHGNSTSWGGAVFCQSSPVSVHNNTIADNVDNGLSFYIPWPTVKNNIITSNSGYAIWSNDPDSTYLVTHNDLWNNALGDHIEIHMPWYEDIYIVGENGNISADPLYAGGGDYHITAGSPCIDLGTDAGVYTDMDGDARPQGVGFDMGADEFAVAGGLEVLLTDYPDSVDPGSVLTFKATVRNNGGDPASFDEAIMVVTGPASLEKTLYHGSPRVVPPGMSLTKPLGLPVPLQAPPGMYTVSVAVYLEDVELSSDSFDVEVVGTGD